MTKTLLTGGEYIIPDDYTVKRNGNVLIIRPKIKHKTQIKYHCNDCRYLGRGKTTKIFIGETSCCMKRKKPNGCYYAAYPMDKACYDFEERIEPRGC